MKTYNTPNIIPVNAVMNATINSLAMQLENMYGFAIQIFFTGTPTGSFKLQSSCDAVPRQSLVFNANGVVVYNPTNWTDIDDSTFSVSAAGDVEWNFTGSQFNFVRVVYTDSSSEASTAIITSSTFNGKGA